jgi:uncharacterized protein
MLRTFTGFWAAALVWLSLMHLSHPAPALAASAANYSPTLPQERLIDPSGVFSRAAAAEVSKALDGLAEDHVDARLVTVPRLDYGLGLTQLGEQLLQQWSAGQNDGPLLLILIDTQTASAAIIANPDLASALDPALLRSTARTTMASALRDGARYRQASLAGISRLQRVLEGSEDPGEPVITETVSPGINVPTREQTESSNAFTWVVVLLVVGTIVPMLTWWIFSR